MIWYRHWLEVRWMLPSMAIAVLLFAAPTGLGLFSAGPSGRFAGEMLDTPLARTLGEAQLRVWALFAERIWAGIYLAGFWLAGNGLRTLAQPGPHASAYTLTLPVSRARLMGTRLAVSVSGIVAMAFLLLVAHAVDPWIRGARAPIWPMIESFAFSVPAAVAWAAVMLACVTFVRPFWAFLLAALLGVAIFLPVRHLVSALPAYGAVPWATLGAFTLLAIIVATVTLRRGAALERE